MNSYKDFSEKKCKNFGYTFSVLFLCIGVYDFFYHSFLFEFYILLSIIFLCFTIFLPTKFKILAYSWEKFGIFLGTIVSPIILSFVYIITIIPVNLIIRILNLDLIQKNFEFKKQSYWQTNKDKKINFRDQF